MEKKFKKILFMIIAVVILMNNTSVKAASRHMTKAYNVEQAVGKAPIVKAYVNGKKINGKNSFEGKIAGADFAEDIQINLEEKEQFSKSGEGIHYIILFDNSKSVDEWQFLQAKKELVRLRQNMAENDRMNLYTVGSDKKKGEKKSIVNAKGKDNLKQQIKAIQQIQRTKRQTVLYRSLNQLLETTDNDSLRTVVILITDGEDDSQGKNNQTYQVNSAIKGSKVPVYGILLSNVSKFPDREKIQNTKKNILDEKISRGYYEECDTSKDVSNGFKNIRSILYQETYVATFREANNSNKTTLDAELLLTCDGEEAVLKNGCFTYNQTGEKDENAPIISKIKKTGSNSIQFVITDDKTKNILGADKKENYTVKDKDGRDWKIDKINVNAAEHIYELVFAKDLYSGDYTIQCNNITDDSQEKNSITKKSKFTFKGLNGSVEAVKSAVKSYWWVGLILIIAAIGAAAIIIIKKKPGKSAEVDAKALVGADSRVIRLTITDRMGAVTDREWNVEGSIFIGRSDICNIHFDDDLLSRQHFVIEITKMACYIADLETTNATFVNGVRISGRRMLADGDVIKAGREKIVFHIVQDGSGEKS